MKYDKSLLKFKEIYSLQKMRTSFEFCMISCNLSIYYLCKQTSKLCHVLNKYILPFTRCLPIDFQPKHNKIAKKRILNSCMSSCPLTLEINKMFGSRPHSHVKAKLENIVHSEAQGQECWKSILANVCYKTVPHSTFSSAFMCSSSTCQ